MNEKRLALGIAALFLGIIVPVYHHVALHAALAHERTNNIVTRMRTVFESLPWIDWVYLGLMWAVGLTLIASGFGLLPKRPVQPPGAGQRGFEVVGVAENGPRR